MIVEYLIVERRRKEFAKGRQAAQKEWMAWYERQQAAQREGRPFDEPPPGEQRVGKGK